MNRRRFSLNIDERTDAMTDEALVCRTWGHKWERKATSRRRFNELLDQGLAEYARYCGNGCGCTWRQMVRIEDGSIVENERRYPGDGAYLVPANSGGRLKRAGAFPAFFARENPGLA